MSSLSRVEIEAGNCVFLKETTKVEGAEAGEVMQSEAIV